jgi:hypothetical protein
MHFEEMVDGAGGTVDRLASLAVKYLADLINVK